MKKLNALLIIIVGLVVLVVIAQPMYILSETDQAVITQFGDPVGGPVQDAGLHFKIPFVQIVNRLEKRMLEWDGNPTKNPTRDKRFIWIDLTGRWRIIDPLKFLQTVNSETQAKQRLDDILESQTKTIVSGQPLIEIVRNSNREMERHLDNEGAASELQEVTEIKYGRNALTRQILARSKPIIEQYGIELVDIRIKRINYTTEVREKIFERMIAERKRAAESFRSEGQGRKAEIEGRMQLELNRISSEAYRVAQETRGTADAEATRIYAEAYSQDPEFYNFLQTLETYKTTIDRNATLILSTDNDYFQYLKNIDSK